MKAVEHLGNRGSSRLLHGLVDCAVAVPATHRTIGRMTEPKIAARTPYVLDAQPGTYAWCACGLSKKQPFCDGSHAGTGLVPKIEVVTVARKIAWCGCKQSCTKPFCDGSHNKLPH